MFSDALPEPKLRVSVGQHSDQGRKAVNQDFYGFRAPEDTFRIDVVACVDHVHGNPVDDPRLRARLRGALAHPAEHTIEPVTQHDRPSFTRDARAARR